MNNNNYDQVLFLYTLININDRGNSNNNEVCKFENSIHQCKTTYVSCKS